MWIEKRKDKYIARERYIEKLTHKRKIISVTIDRDTPQERSKARQKLDDLILDRTEYLPIKNRLGQLVAIYKFESKTTLKESTHTRNVSECNTFLKVLGDVDLDELSVICFIAMPFFRVVDTFSRFQYHFSGQKVGRPTLQLRIICYRFWQCLP